ncbi:hypothetical protein KKF55_01235 [Patescibacteria group bacterium]|nr:hypothetical protein [Patescibacteria group bacterium]
MKRFLFLCVPLVFITACSGWNVPVEPIVEKGTGSVIDEQQHPAALGPIFEEEVDLCEELVADEQDHCYQQEASDKEDFVICENIQGERFTYIAGNPPKDKCFSMVALKMCDPTICDYIQGGQSYFSPTECKQRIAKYCP